MKNDKKHLDIDLEFLDRKETIRAARKQPEVADQTAHTPTTVSTGYKYNWKNILIIGCIILFFGWAMISETDTSAPPANTSTYSNTTNSSSESELIRAARRALDAKGNQLSAESSQLDSKRIELENEYFDNTSDASIDQYNARVDDYNAKLESFKNRARIHQENIDAFNERVETY